MGYDGVNIGEKDLILGYQFISKVAEKANFPFISSNLANKAGKPSIFTSHMIKEISGLRIGIFGLIDAKMLKRDDPVIPTCDPMKKARRIVMDLKQKCDFIIALSQLGEAGDAKLARTVPGIDLIVGGMKSKTIRYSKIEDTILVRVIPRGGYLGILEVNIREKGHPYRFSDLGDRDELVRKIEHIRFQSSLIEDRMDELSSKEKKVKLRELKILKGREKQLQAKVASYDAKNSFRNQIIPINIRIEDDPVVSQLVKEYRQ